MMLLQIYFDIPAGREADFESLYREVYAPALRKQAGYLKSSLLRLFPPAVAREIDAAPADHTYQMELAFDTEENRRRWAASPEHQVAWPLAAGMASRVAWRGYDIAAGDDAGAPNTAQEAL
jgi:antibiotic biosynthesis monooxygenase (ABM) superfamily enzyme